MRPPSLKLTISSDSPSGCSVTTTPMVSAVCGGLVVMMVAFSGCQSFKSPQWIQNASNLGRKNADQGASDASPANRRKPFSLASQTVTSDQPPVRPDSLRDKDLHAESLSEKELLGLEKSEVGKKLIAEKGIDTSKVDSIILIEPGVAYFTKSRSSII